ncbi:MAG: polyphosphate kinase 1, partial [Treponema sp.]|nr:polyphosphate kinase 1 [Treponema sp.]
MTGRFDRELSWIKYNSRVLEEALRGDLPPLERFRFLSIVSANFDEFFMVRIAALKRALASDPGAGEPLRTAGAMIRPMFARLYDCLGGEIFPALAAGGLELRRPPFTAGETGYLKPLFMREIAPVLTPLRFGPADPGGSGEEPLPAVANGLLYGAFLLEEAAAGTGAPKAGATTAETGTGAGTAGAGAGTYVSIVEIPPALDRIVWIGGSRQRWALVEDLLMLWGDTFFSGYSVKERMLFCIHRDADFPVDERRDEDFVEAMEEVLINRDRSPAVCMMYSPGSDTVAGIIARRHGLGPEDLFPAGGPLNLSALGSLIQVQGFDQLKLESPKPCPHPGFPPGVSVWEALREGDILLALPYQSFDPVIRFFKEAAEDP